MADDNVVEIVIKASTDQATADLQKVGQAAQSAAGTAVDGFEKSRIGALGYRAGAHELLSELGLHGPMSRGLAHGAAQLAESYGKAALALGVVGIAALAAYKIYEHFAEATKKKREELDKSVKSLEGEVSALYRNEGANAAVEKANYRLLEAKRALLLLDLKKKIDEDSKALKDQERELDIAAGKVHTFGSVVSGAVRLMFRETATEFKKNNAEHAKELGLKFGITKAELDKERAEYKKFSKDVSYASYSGEKARLEAIKKNEENISKVLEQAQHKREVLGLKGFQKHMAEMAREHKRELDDLKKLNASKAQIAELEATQEMEWQQAITENEIAERQKQLEAAGQAYDNLTAAAKMMYDRQGQMGSAAASAYKTLAKGKIIATTAEAAISAYKDGVEGGGPAGAVLGALYAAAAVAYGMSQLSAVDSQSPSTAPPAIPTYSASPITGLPNSPSGKTTTPGPLIQVNVYGSVTSEGDLARRLVPLIYQAKGDGVGAGN